MHVSQPTWHHIPEDGILRSYDCGNLKSHLINVLAEVKYLIK